MSTIRKDTLTYPSCRFCFTHYLQAVILEDLHLYIRLCREHMKHFIQNLEPGLLKSVLKEKYGND